MATLRIATYNVLADTYVRPAWYPHTPAELLAAGARYDGLIDRVLGLDADVVCMQEVERPFLTALRRRVSPLGYRVELANKAGGRPDGCATISRLPLADSWFLHYHDDTPPSGHVALAVSLIQGPRRLTIVNTHVRWNPPDKRSRAHIGVRQLEELVDELRARGPLDDVIVCGDFNATPDSDVVGRLLAAGFRDAFAALPDAYTCNPNQTAKRIDYLFYGPGLTATPRPLPAIDDHTPLPSRTEPSDHLPVVAELG